MQGKADWPCQVAGEGSFAGKTSNFGLQVFCRIRILSPSLPWEKLMVLRSGTAAVTFNSCSIRALHMTISVRNTDLAFKGEFPHRKSWSTRGFHPLSLLTDRKLLGSAFSELSYTSKQHRFPHCPSREQNFFQLCVHNTLSIPPEQEREEVPMPATHWFLPVKQLKNQNDPVENSISLPISMSYLIPNQKKSPHLWGKEDGGCERFKIRWIFVKAPALE